VTEPPSGRRVVSSRALGRPRMNAPPLPRKLVAYHEAAHAVVARALGCPVVRVEVARTASGGGRCVHATAVTFRVAGSRRIRGTPLRRETTRRERAASALRQRDAGTATAALAGVAL
jgi:hypothetical protein